MEYTFVNKGCRVRHLYLCETSAKPGYISGGNIYDYPLCKTCEKTHEKFSQWGKNRWVRVSTPNAMRKLLEDQKVRIWNALRTKYLNMWFDLNDINLSEKELSEVMLGGASLKGANFSNSDLSGAQFNSANLNYANLSYTRLNAASFNFAEMRYTNMQGSYGSGVGFTRASLCYANLSNAVLTRSNFFEADLGDASLINADLRESNLSRITLCGTEFDQTKVPYGNGTHAVVSMKIVTD